MKCSNCKEENLSTAKFCIYCGIKIVPQVKSCHDCGRTDLPEAAIFCPDCGKKLAFAFASYTEMGGGVPIEMVAIEGGTFNIGSNDIVASLREKPEHKVQVSSFFMGKYPVTFAQYDAYCIATGAEKPSDEGWGRGNRPVVNVNWHEAVSFCIWLSRQTGKTYRLPTEAEWEYAAKGGQVNVYSGSDNLGDVAWYEENSGSQAHEVGQKRPNSFGLYDMSGNVWEWCHDWYGGDYYSKSPIDNPSGPINGTNRVLRGGSWFSNAGRCRVSYRSICEPDFRDYGGGFRVVVSQ